MFKHQFLKIQVEFIMFIDYSIDYHLLQVYTTIYTRSTLQFTPNLLPNLPPNLPNLLPNLPPNLHPNLPYTLHTTNTGDSLRVSQKPGEMGKTHRLPPIYTKFTLQPGKNLVKSLI